MHECIVLNKPFMVDIRSDRQLFDHLKQLYRFSNLVTVKNRFVRVSDVPYVKHYSRFVHDMPVSDFMTEQVRKSSQDMKDLFGDEIFSNNISLRNAPTPLYAFGSDDVTCTPSIFFLLRRFYFVILFVLCILSRLHL